MARKELAAPQKVTDTESITKLEKTMVDSAKLPKEIKDTDAYRLVPQGLMQPSRSTAVFISHDGKLSRRADSKTSIAVVQNQPEQPIFKRKDLLVKGTDAMPQMQARQEFLIAEILAQQTKKKQSSRVDNGQSVMDIDVDLLFTYFEKQNRKRIEKAFDGV